ncbi:uncharacterized protein [Procambarus clarkii]|uniref:uncharacterized protein n=1 Tax=Procambarus clarkii TaxID=6728 RepID=UPI0037426096
MISAARQLQEKCQEQHRDLFVTFDDLTKDFDTVSRDDLWKIMEKFGSPGKFTVIVRQFHEGMMTKVLDNGEESTVIPGTSGVKQGYVLALTLFSMVFSAMLTDVFLDISEHEVFHPARMEYPSDPGLTVACSTSACDNFGLFISTRKTEVKYQPAPRIPYQEPHINIKGQNLQALDNFTYLATILSRAVNIHAEVNNRIAKASAAFLSLLTPYRVVEKIPDTEVLEGAGIPSVYTILQKTHARWAGHVVRMHDSRLPKQLLYGELYRGTHSVGGQKKRFKDCLKMTLKDLDINPNTWESLAQDRPTWKTKSPQGPLRQKIYGLQRPKGMLHVQS